MTGFASLCSAGCLALAALAGPAASQIETITPPERSWFPMHGSFVPRFADELAADNARARMGLRGPVERVELTDLTDAEADPQEEVEPDRLVIVFDERGRYRSMSFISVYMDPQETAFTVTETDDGYRVAGEVGGMAMATGYSFKDGTLVGYELSGMDGSVIVRIAERHENGTARLVTVANLFEDPMEARFTDDGRVSGVKQYGVEETHVWGDGTLTVKDAEGKETITGSIDQYGNMTEWTMPDLFGNDPDARASIRARYSYDEQGNWTALVIETLDEEIWQREMEFKRTIGYFAKDKEE